MFLKGIFKKKKAVSDIETTLNESSKKRDIIFNAQEPMSENYGYSPINPICTFSINHSIKYLNRLKTTNGERLFWIRIGSMSLVECNNARNVIVDKYQLYLHGEPNTIIYICPYAKDSSYTPKGLVLTDEKEQSDFCGDICELAQKENLTSEQFVRIQALEYENLKLFRNKLDSELENLQQMYPWFRIEDEMRNSLFIDLIDFGIDAKTVFEYIHRNELFKQVVALEDLSSAEKSKECIIGILEKASISIRQNIVNSCSLIKEEFGVADQQIEKMLRAEIDAACLEWDFTLLVEKAKKVKRNYPQFELVNEYANLKFRKMLRKFDMQVVYEIQHFSELFVRADESNELN